jgi:hypothetical protein
MLSESFCCDASNIGIDGKIRQKMNGLLVNLPPGPERQAALIQIGLFQARLDTLARK